MAKRARRGGGRTGGVSSPADGGLPLGDARHPSARRKNIPPAKIAAEGVVPVIPKARYAYNPHLPPVLRFDPSGGADALPELIREAGRRPLTPDEQRLLAEALRHHEPWLEWAGKREKKWFEVDPPRSERVQTVESGPLAGFCGEILWLTDPSAWSTDDSGIRPARSRSS